MYRNASRFAVNTESGIHKIKIKLNNVKRIRKTNPVDKAVCVSELELYKCLNNSFNTDLNNKIKACW